MTIRNAVYAASAMVALLAAAATAADTVATATLRNTSGPFGGSYAFLFGNSSDGTGESAVVKVSTAALSGTPTQLRITRLKWAVHGMNVSVLFDADADDRVAILTGNGELNEDNDGPIKDPRSTGATGNVLFTSQVVASTATVRPGYTIYMELKKVQ